MAVKDYIVPLVPATASGTTAQSDPITAGGHLEAVRLVRPTTNQISTVANITITDLLSGLELFNATATSTGSQTWFPRNTHFQTASATGELALTSNATPPTWQDRYPVAGNSRFKVVVASGGANTSGVLHLYLSGA